MRTQILQGERGLVAHVTLPKAKTLAQYDRLELDFALGCPGARACRLTPLCSPATRQHPPAPWHLL